MPLVEKLLFKFKELIPPREQIVIRPRRNLAQHHRPQQHPREHAADDPRQPHPLRRPAPHETGEAEDQQLE